MRDRLQAAYENIQASSGIRDGDTANIDRLVVQLDGFLKDVDTIPQRLSNFSSNISSLSAWMLNLKNQPLEIDYLRIQSEDVAVPEGQRRVLPDPVLHGEAVRRLLCHGLQLHRRYYRRGRGTQCVDWPRAGSGADHQGAGG